MMANEDGTRSRLSFKTSATNGLRRCEMRKRLFVDCDDCLVLYDSADGESYHPYGFARGERYHVNAPLAESIRAFARDNPCAMIVVWSGGGAQYARMVANMALHGVDVTAMTKDRSTFDFVRSGDIVVDDMADSVRGVAAEVLRPDEWRYDGTE